MQGHFCYFEANGAAWIWESCGPAFLTQNMRRFPAHRSAAAVNLTIRSNNLENVSPMVVSCCSYDLPLNPLGCLATAATTDKK